MTDKLKEVLERAKTWPEADQAELAAVAQEIEERHREEYRATPDELRSIDEADQSGVASDEEIAEAFRQFRQA